MKDIFLSRPNWFDKTFEDGIKNFYNLLKSNEVNPRTIGQSDYPSETPLDGVIKLMKKCQGTIVLGVPQIEILNGKIKEKDISAPIHLGTEWNHIEAALAHSMNHPLLVIHHSTVKRGIFDRGACNTFLYSVDMKNPSWPLSDEISGALINWKSELKELVFSKNDFLEKPTIQWGMYKFENEIGLFCPVCFQKDGLKIPTSRLDTKFYQCPNCKAKFS